MIYFTAEGEVVASADISRNYIASDGSLYTSVYRGNEATEKGRVTRLERRCQFEVGIQNNDGDHRLTNHVERISRQNIKCTDLTINRCLGIENF